MQEYGVGIFITIPTKSSLKKALKKNLITVNGDQASTATMIKGGELIELLVSKETNKKELIFPLNILFEDDYLALIHKPAGILTSGNKFMTIANALEQNLQKSKQEDAVPPKPIHRLDYATTGIILVGKTASTIRALNKMFETKQVSKTYYAVTIGMMKQYGEVKISVDNKEAYSVYEVINSVPSERFGQLNLVRLSPKTGRRHQLRIHVAHIGNPILGDRDYGREPLILKGKGMYLHAYQLTFIHPITNQELTIKDELPLKFKKIFPLSEM